MFFFFKQKTAYEMRISDWSSDVCSSDLQMGALLTKHDGSGSSTAAGNERIAFQQRVEDKYRQQLAQLLTPLVGADNFSTEVQAEVNLDETQAASASYNDGALRAEQGNWTTQDRKRVA